MSEGRAEDVGGQAARGRRRGTVRADHQGHRSHGSRQVRIEAIVARTGGGAAEVDQRRRLGGRIDQDGVAADLTVGQSRLAEHHQLAQERVEQSVRDVRRREDGQAVPGRKLADEEGIAGGSRPTRSHDFGER